VALVADQCHSQAPATNPNPNPSPPTPTPTISNPNPKALQSPGWLDDGGGPPLFSAVVKAPSDDGHQVRLNSDCGGVWELGMVCGGVCGVLGGLWEEGQGLQQRV